MSLNSSLITKLRESSLIVNEQSCLRGRRVYGWEVRSKKTRVILLSDYCLKTCTSFNFILIFTSYCSVAFWQLITNYYDDDDDDDDDDDNHTNHNHTHNRNPKITSSNLIWTRSFWTTVPHVTQIA